MAKIPTRGKIHVFLKAPASSPAAFSASDELPQNLVDAVQPTANGRSFEYDTFGDTGINRVADIQDLQIQITALVDPSDPIVQLLYDRWNSGDRLIDALVIAGDLPATGASNVAVWARMVIEQFTLNTPRPGLAQLQVQLSAGDGNTIGHGYNLDAYPSI